MNGFFDFRLELLSKVYSNALIDLELDLLPSKRSLVFLLIFKATEAVDKFFSGSIIEPRRVFELLVVRFSSVKLCFPAKLAEDALCWNETVNFVFVFELYVDYFIIISIYRILCIISFS